LRREKPALLKSNDSHTAIMRDTSEKEGVMLDFSSFPQASWLRWAAARPEDADLLIMGIPFDNAVSLNKGAAQAPKRLRDLSIDLSDTTEDFHEIRKGILYDYGDVHYDLHWERYFALLQERAEELMRTGRRCLFLGGDHSVTIPLHKAFGAVHREEKIGIVHMDAHYDLCPAYDGSAWSHACTEARALEDVVQGRDLTFVGVRVAEVDELELLRAHPDIRTWRAADVHREGAEAVAEALRRRYENYDAVYLTLDIDVLDPAYAPGTGTPASGGLTSRELIELFRRVLRTLPVRAMDLVEVAPPLDVNDITSWAALRIIHELFGFVSDSGKDAIRG
jgi:agmatinase